MKVNLFSIPILISFLRKLISGQDKFYWLGLVTPVHYYLFALTERADISVNSLDQARNFQVGVVNQHATHQYLLQSKFHQLHVVNSSLFNIRKARVGRIDLFTMSSAGLLRRCEQEKIDCKIFKPVLKLNGISNGLYLALSLESSTALKAKLSQSYQHLVKNGRTFVEKR